jgi:8-oxo-dGTP pyrophosphatase MutT (NUDIX family)
VEIKEIEQAIEAAESSVEAARDEVRIETGIHDVAKFNELAAPVEAKQDAPWLRRSKTSSGADEIVVVDLDRGVERAASPEEIERGIFYSDFEQYKQGKAA